MIPKELMKPEYIWFIGGVITLLSEFAFPTLIFFFFGIAAMIVGVLVLVFSDMSLTLQFSTFLILSILLIMGLRKRFQTVFYGEAEIKYPKKTDEFVGKEAIVKSIISPTKSGKVELHGSLWTAFSNEHHEIGSAVKVVKKDNIHLYVTSVEQNATSQPTQSTDETDASDSKLT